MLSLVRRNTALGLVVTICLLASGIPSASALHGTTEPGVALCGTVTNTAGWPLEDIRVRAVGRGLTNSDHFPQAVLTGPDGSFSIEILTDFYELVIEDTRTRFDRAGATYLPKEVAVRGHQSQAGHCGDSGVDLGQVELDAPLTGFLEVQVRDHIDDALVPDADVAVRVLGVAEWGRARTDGSGLARVACPLHVPVDLEIQADGYRPETADASCTPDVGEATVEMWRAPVSVSGTIRDLQTNETVPDADVAFTASEPAELSLPAGHPYTLEDTSDGNGAYEVTLPWGIVFSGHVTKSGYEGAATDAVAPTRGDIANGLQNNVTMDRLELLFNGTVHDVFGDGVAATLTFDGPAPANTRHTEDAGSSGAFSVDLPFGDYQVNVTADGMNARIDCQLSLPHDATATFDDVCLVLIKAGHGAVEGTILDDLTNKSLDGALPEFEPTGGAATAVGGDRTFVQELEPGDYTYSVAEEGYQVLVGDVSILANEIDSLGELRLTREEFRHTVAVSDGGVPVGGAEVCPIFVPAAEGDDPIPGDCGVTDDAGQVMFDLQWTSEGGALDVGDYMFTVERMNEVPLYYLEPCAVAVDIDRNDGSGSSTDCPATAVSALSTPIGPFLDAHTGGAVEGVTVTTGLPGNVSCDAPYDCQGVTDATGQTTLLLPEGLNFTLSAVAGLYRDTEAATTAAGQPAFGDHRLYRTSSTFTVNLKDAHTEGDIQGAAVAAVGSGFACDPAGADGYVCAAPSDAEGQAVLTLPWGVFDITTAAAAYDVDLEIGEVEQAVLFHDAAGSADASTEGEMTLRLIRQAGEAIQVSVVDFQGDPLDAASARVSTERFDGFVCNPEGAAAREPGFAACDMDQVFGGEATQLFLPHGTTSDHRWSIVAKAPDHFREEAFEVDAGEDVDLVFWPLTFDLVIDPLDVASEDTAPLVVVCIRNLDQDLANPTTGPQAEVCRTSGLNAEQVTFHGTDWRRTGPEDETDRFLVRAVGTLHFPSAIVRQFGPAAPNATIPMVPLDPTVPEPRTGVVSGQVRDGDGRPAPGSEVAGVSGAEVQVASDSCLVPSPPSVTAVDGRFDVPVSCHGAFQVDVSDVRYEPVATQEVMVPDNGPVVFTLDRLQGTLSVTVRDTRTGAPVAGATVTVTGVDTTTETTGLTDLDGTFQVQVPWGVYTLQADAPDGEWLVASAQGATVVAPGGDADQALMLFSTPPIDEPSPCGEEGTPDLCEPAEDDGSVRFGQSRARGTQGDIHGTWAVVAPQIGAAPMASVGPTFEIPSSYAGPHGGTWVLAYTPNPVGGLTGMPSFPITVTLSYEVAGESRILEATLTEALVGPSPFVSPTLMLVVNLHEDEVVTCEGPRSMCGVEGVDPQAALRMRHFTPT